jgi:preprotein translocase subunit YajC
MSSLVAAGSSSGGIGNLLIFALPVLLIGFMSITQRRRQKEAQRIQSSLSVGDEVTTTSGLLGRITDLGDKLATLEVSPGVAVRFDRRAIAGPAPTESTANESTASDSASTNSASSSSSASSKSASRDAETDGLSGPTTLNDSDAS